MSYSSSDDKAHVAGLFKPNELDAWEDDAVDKEQQEIMKELSRLMMTQAVNMDNKAPELAWLTQNIRVTKLWNCDVFII